MNTTNRERPWSGAGGICVLAISLLLPCTALADGLAYGVSGGTMSVQATEQRAVLWLNDGTWELHIQPVFERQAGAAAWVVPFPVRPEVSLGQADLFDQLELLTGPAFLETCTKPCCGECLDGGAESGSVDGGQGLVTVWERDSLGDLDYVLLSAADGGSAVGWLEANGYAVPDSARPALEVLTREGTVFFAARLSADADPAKPLAPVRFRLPDLAEPMYPLRTTAAGVGQGRLGLTLWVVAPGDQLWLPERGVVGTLGASRLCGPQEYQKAMDALFEEHQGRYLALTYRVLIADSERYARREICHRHGYGEEDCLQLSELSVEVPDRWLGELDAMAEQDALVLRFEGRLPASAMTLDLVFEAEEPDQGPWVEDTFLCDTGPCYSCSTPDGGSGSEGSGGGCSLVATGSSMLGGVLLLGLALLLGCRRRA